MKTASPLLGPRPLLGHSSVEFPFLDLEDNQGKDFSLITNN